MEYWRRGGEGLNYCVYESLKGIRGIGVMEGFGERERGLSVGSLGWMEGKGGSMGVGNGEYEIELVKGEGGWGEDGEEGEIVVGRDKGKGVGLLKEYYGDGEVRGEGWEDGMY